MRVLLKDGADHSGWLVAGREYTVLSIEVNANAHVVYRIRSEDNGQPVLFDAKAFRITDSSLSPVWQVACLEDGSHSFEPEPWSRPGFWEAFFDHDSDTVRVYREQVALIEHDSLAEHDEEP